MTSSIATELQAAPGADRPAVAGVAAGAWSGMSNNRMIALRSLALAMPLAAGLAAYGWRAAAAVATVIITALLAAVFWSRVGRRGAELRFAGIFHLSLLLALTLPAHLFAREISLDGTPPIIATVWPILPAAGLMLVMLCWLLGGSHRIHPVLLTHLLVVVLFQPAQESRWVLQPSAIFFRGPAGRAGRTGRREHKVGGPG